MTLALHGTDRTEKRILSPMPWRRTPTETLSLYYQPLLDAVDRGRHIGHVLLLRWNHPILSNIPPSVFAPLTEECGQIEAPGSRAIEQACRGRQSSRARTHSRRADRSAALIPAATKSSGNVPCTIRLAVARASAEDIMMP